MIDAENEPTGVVWLDSSRVGIVKRLHAMIKISKANAASTQHDPERARFSVFSSLSFPGNFMISYDATKRQVISLRSDANSGDCLSGRLNISTDFMTWTGQILREIGARKYESDFSELFKFSCGWLGYFGYSMRHESMCSSVPVSCSKGDGLFKLPTDSTLLFASTAFVHDNVHNESTRSVSSLKTRRVLLN